ncbi:MAG: PqqD family protein [Clostridia bacterium]|nr:PqqD family protein [Clostridia bacterium]
MKLKSNFVTREVMGETLLMPVGDHLQKLNGIFTLNELGVFILKRLPDAEDEADIVDSILEEYEIDRQTAENHVKKFLDKLRAIELI